MIKIISITSLLLFTQLSFATSLKPMSDCDMEIDYSYYSICYSQTHRQAKWTFHQLSRAQINGPAKRKNNYRADLNLSDPVNKSDYKGTGYDRGHLVPAGDMKLNKSSMSQTFYMTNMSPQKPDLNRKIWNQLENAVRAMVINLGDAYVVSAPILTSGLGQLPSHVSIPKHYYKIIYFPKAKLMRAYLFENRGYKKGISYQQMQVSVDSIEDETGIDFFSELPDQLEDQLESQVK